ncbi:MAG: hypothetical protein BGO41_09340 [Clostridiales bacterium 38-18]|nr:MAG: hypothetical protein BGO41_09340 [Clostridiales bacterium 38-18]
MTNNELRNELLGIDDKFIYHYCSINAFYGIITSKSLWMTSLASTNDSKELKVAQTVLDKCIEELIKRSDDESKTNILKLIKSAPLNKNLKKNRKTKNFYGVSFVNEFDSLTHWERYGDNSKGVCLKINSSIIKHMLNFNGIPDEFCTWFRLNEVIYNNESQISMILNQMISNINSLYDIVGDKIYTDELYAFSIYYAVLSMTTPIFKDSGFSDEREMKYFFEESEPEAMINLLSQTEDIEGMSRFIENFRIFINDKGLSASNKKFGIFGTEIRSYYALNLEEIWNSILISEIILGPKCIQRKNELKEFLKSNGLTGTKIKVSKIPIR